MYCAYVNSLYNFLRLKLVASTHQPVKHTSYMLVFTYIYFLNNILTAIDSVFSNEIIILIK
jgi:hypothetical protein